MTETDMLVAVRKVRMEAERLRLACVQIANGSALLHIAYDREVELKRSLAEAAALGALRVVK